MENTVLFICSSPQSFLATAMMNKIRSEGYEVTLSVPDYSFISSLPCSSMMRLMTSRPPIMA